MNTYIVLFRGINVGGHNILPMKDLVNLLESMDCKNIRTYIQSGNVVFRRDIDDTEKFANVISAKIRTVHGFEPEVQLLSKQEIQNVIKNNPFDTKEGKALHFLFLFSQPENPDIEKLNFLKRSTEKFKLTEKVFYLFAPDGIGRSKLAANAEKCLGVSATGRNWNTVNKLISMID